MVNERIAAAPSSLVPTNFICYDNYAARGRQRAEEKLPKLLEDIRAIADQHSQTDPKFQSDRLYLRLSAASSDNS